ncbi:MAG: rRNA pseudouridine synthase [Cohaesibacteraceae bacterium]|nr:rRNA pseudouridine synthase [Cohaesibacteraceae bacterium]MBL4875261.1 rRNA pseudouridine synthase [Cohaesibacteraceae bacterium]
MEHKKPQNTAKADETSPQRSGDRIAKVLARAGLCSRRDAENWIADGRVVLNGKKLTSPAQNVTARDKIEVDGKPLPRRERTRLWLYHKPRGLVTTSRDPEGRSTVFDRLPPELPRVISVGRLDINTEGLLLLTNDGGLARILELPSTGWLRRYRVRAYGSITQERLDSLQEGFAVDGVLYGSIEADIERVQGHNIWLNIGLREGKNREIKVVLGALGLEVNRLIRVSYGPFQLGDLDEGETREIKGRVLRDQFSEQLMKDAGVDFEAPTREEIVAETKRFVRKQAHEANSPAKDAKPARKPAVKKGPKRGLRDGEVFTSKREADAARPKTDKKKFQNPRGFDKTGADDASGGKREFKKRDTRSNSSRSTATKSRTATTSRNDSKPEERKFVKKSTSAGIQPKKGWAKAGGSKAKPSKPGARNADRRR